MNTEEIIASLEQERYPLTQAIEALTASHAAGKRRGRRPGRHMSAAARKRIAKAKRAWWAARKKGKIKE